MVEVTDEFSFDQLKKKSISKTLCPFLLVFYLHHTFGLEVPGVGSRAQEPTTEVIVPRLKLDVTVLIVTVNRERLVGVSHIGFPLGTEAVPVRVIDELGALRLLLGDVERLVGDGGVC